MACGHVACASLSVPNPGSNDSSSAASTRPVCDEWGFYDPEQAGFEALVRRVTPKDDDQTSCVQASPLPLEPATSTL